MDLKVVGKNYDVTHTGIELPSSVLSKLEPVDVYVFKLSTTGYELDDPQHKSIYVGCNDFYDTETNVYGEEEMVFIPEWVAAYLGVDFGETVRLEQCSDPPRADYICIQPQNEALMNSLPDLEDFFTFYLQNFKVIQTGIRYPVSVAGGDYYIYIEKLESASQSLDFAVIVNVDLTTDFGVPVERPPTPPPTVSQLPSVRPLSFAPPVPMATPPRAPEDPQKFRAFSGTGYRLGSE